MLNRRNAQGCARSKRKACVSESSDGKDKYRKGGSTGGDKESESADVGIKEKGNKRKVRGKQL